MCRMDSMLLFHILDSILFGVLDGIQFRDYELRTVSDSEIGWFLQLAPFGLFGVFSSLPQSSPAFFNILQTSPVFSSLLQSSPSIFSNILQRCLVHFRIGFRVHNIYPLPELCAEVLRIISVSPFPPMLQTHRV